MAFTLVPIAPLIQGLLGCIIIVQVIVFCTLGLRFRYRLLSRASLGWDDWLAVASATFGSGMIICMGLFSTAGIGYHIEEVSGNLPTVSKLIFAYELVYHCTIGAAKLSALCFYLRAFSKHFIRKVVIASLAVVCLQSLAVILWSLLICRPISLFWAEDEEPFCGNRRPMYMTASILAILTDLLIIGIPIPVIWGLKMKRSKKKGVIGLFSTGLIMTIVSVIRIMSIMWIDEEDVTYSASLFMFFSALEPCVATLCVCLPMLSPLFNRCFGHRTGNTPISHPSAEPSQSISKPRRRPGFSRLDDVNGGSYEMFPRKEASGPSEDVSKEEVSIIQSKAISAESLSAESLNSLDRDTDVIYRGEHR